MKPKLLILVLIYGIVSLLFYSVGFSRVTEDFESISESDRNHEIVQNDASTGKPRLFLLVGPQKAGASLVISMLSMLGSNSGTLPGDNWNYRRVTPQNKDFDCEMDNYGGYHDCVASEGLMERIESSKKDGKNLFLFDENLDQNFMNGLRDAINDEDWDVTVIVMYRRINEWLLSWYNLISKTTNRDSDGNILFDENGHPYRTQHTEWPDQGGVHVPTFNAWYKEYTKFWFYTPRLLHKQHRSIGWYIKYKRLFDNVVLYNIHNQSRDDLTEDFFCNVLDAKNSCQKIRNKAFPPPRAIRPANLDLDILSVYAYEKGFIPKSVKRQEVIEAVANHITNTGKLLPRKPCDGEMKDQIRGLLVETETIMVGEDSWSDAKEAELLEEYNSFMKKGKMCDVDGDAVLADEEWVSFFQSLKDPAQ